jgi:hypothetical protein
VKPPIEMPTDFYSSQEFEPQRVDYHAPEAGGRVSGVQAGFPLWLGLWTLDIVGPAESDAIRVFMRRLRGASRRFLGRDLLRQYPHAYPNGFAGLLRAGGGAFDGSATGWSEVIAADGDSAVTLHGFPVGFVLSTLDQIDFRYNATDDGVAGLPWRALTSVVVGGVADGGGNITVTCEPPIPSAVPNTAVAHVDQPACVMVQLSDKTNIGPVGRRLAVQSGQIAGIQDIRG